MYTKTSLRHIKLTKKAKIAIGRSNKVQGDGESETIVNDEKGFRRNRNNRTSSDDGETLVTDKGFRSNRNIRTSSNDGETLVTDKKGFRRNSRTSSKDGVSVTYQNNKLYKRDGKDETFRGDRMVLNDNRRKRVFSDRSNDGERMGNRGLRRERKSRETDPFDRLISVKKRDSDRIDRKDRSDKKVGTMKLEYGNETERNRNGSDNVGRPMKEKNYGKKSIGDDREGEKDRRKKMKRDIRIDPNDISNKRIDDSIVTTGTAEKKEENIDKDKRVEMSMNAQFRAIIPSPSILSFVEDNYLGRRRMIELSRAGYNTELSAPLDNIPSSNISERARIEEPVFRNKLTFFAAANVSSSFPAPELPEIAFAGRSNVGKSSMLNALTRQWGVARTSDKPGLTQTINFFKLGPKVSLVDLPGYGFAYAKDEVKEAWEDLVKEYVSTREGLKRVCLLIDTKWGMKPRDIELIDLMERSQTKYQIVLTKTDLVFPIDVARRAMQIEESLKAKKFAIQPAMMVSSKSGAGIRTLRTVLSKIARIVKV